MKFDVMRQHLGDVLYLPGAQREANESDVRHLIAAGVLKKAEGASPLNKVEGRSAHNKETAFVPPLSERTVAQLKAIAAERGIDLGDASKKDDIVAAIELAMEVAG